ncbi:MAG: hypothetical protein GY757_48375 [bacterium]|nr:hypothetical protein [bacterium]
MRQFSSYGPINPKLHYHAPRCELIDKAYRSLVGEISSEDGGYITVWAPRQCGKTWVMQEAVEKLKQSGQYEVAIISLERAKELRDEKKILEIVIEKLQHTFERSLPPINEINELPMLFTKQYFQKPVILILDEFDALEETFINRFAAIFRDIFISRLNERNKNYRDKTYLLHGLALVGVRSVLGIENVTGSPFNVQRSLNVPNLTQKEVTELFLWYEKEINHAVEPAVIERLYYETNGQPGLTCWFGELLTGGFEYYTVDKTRPIGMQAFEKVYGAAIDILPNNTILNIISKSKKEPEKTFVLKLFQTDEKLKFRYDDTSINSLYMNGVINKEKAADHRYYVRFSSPFVQKRLFNYYSGELFGEMGQLVEPFITLEHIVAPTHLDIPGIMDLYQKYLDKNKTWLFKDVPRRSDLRVYEAVFHFNLFTYLDEFLRSKKGRVHPEFPTGNGKIDLLITYADKTYGIELKSFTDQPGYSDSLEQAARYGKQLGLAEIYLVTFVGSIDEKNRQTYETHYIQPETNVTVKPIFIQTGEG